jgi:hypothetical protein
MLYPLIYRYQKHLYGNEFWPNYGVVWDPYHNENTCNNVDFCAIILNRMKSRIL